jgi:hypothetical protein
MSQPKHQKHPLKPAQTNTDLMIADVPVVISISHGEETLAEYEEVIDLEFSPQTLDGRTNMRRFSLLKEAKGLSTESALFTLASDAIRDHAQQFISRLSMASKLGSAAQHELHLHIKRNGTITYRRPINS